MITMYLTGLRKSFLGNGPHWGAFLALFFAASAFCADTWRYDWNTRVDRDGQPAGIYTNTPYPITETSATYVIKSDEFPAGKTYFLGTKYFVDGLSGNNANDGLSLQSPKRTISAAVAASGRGNKTVIVRGAHNGFSGIYPETISLYGIAGLSDTNRFMLIGYAQERPAIDGTNGITSPISTTGETETYITLQRLIIQNSRATGVRLGNLTSKLDGHFNLVDVWITNCAANTFQNFADGNVYYLNVDDGWILHCTSEHSMGHGFKMGDGTSRCIVEWSQAFECGYWSTMVSDFGITNWTKQLGTHPSALDFPNDAGVVATAITARYNVAHDSLFYGMQLRNVTNTVAHHNEIYHTPHFNDIPGTSSGASGNPQMLVLGQGSGTNNLLGSVDIYANWIHDSSDTNASGIGVNVLASGRSVRIFNNVLARNSLTEINLYGFPLTNSRSIFIFNNSLLHSNSTPALSASANYSSAEVWITNNIIVNKGSGACVALDADIAHGYNLFYSSSGNKGVTLNSTELYGDPLFLDENKLVVVVGSPAIGKGASLGTFFTIDFGGRSRSVPWSIGAYANEKPRPPAAHRFVTPP